ncbi:sensor histidine kinase [Spirochaeta isovalerica]|uniref:Two-component system sensor histidine kinase YesM n=1 Tax=Spirochaeta isovalerica TaxID=150 RepID=A0A841R923_9SPIO|nr:sensor histidine kinase [Spirochaeta isovalerica]MBB6479218.1 two-component system sensor histidine kinase YesM [Spirochaeta isovalerica]
MSRMVRTVEGMLPFLRSYSIKNKIRTFNIIIIGIMFIPVVFSITSSVLQTMRYDRIITNMEMANQLNQIIISDVTDEIWDIFAGNKKFSEGNQYQIISDIHMRLDGIMAQTSSVKNRRMLEVAGRAVRTMTDYVDRLGAQMRRNESVFENEKIVEEIRGVTALISDILQDFIVLEIESTAQTNETIKRSTWLLAGVQSAIFLLVVLFAVFAQRSVSLSINKPIARLEEMSRRIAGGDLDVSVSLPQVKELDSLTEHLNTMAVRIRELLEKNIQEQKNHRKSEMKALQAQITPHFLYNTLDTIVWLAESREYDQVIGVTRAFSSFFRTSLSRGKDWIPVEEEFKHVESYLTIQKIRYRDILDYTVEYDKTMAENVMVKLLLQPLVENALYHGIKNKRGKGTLRVRGWMDEQGMCFSVEDNGIGMSEERLEDILGQINQISEPDSHNDIYGLYNVNKRLELYYSSAARLEIESRFREGTRVFFSLPVVNSYV